MSTAEATREFSTETKELGDRIVPVATDVAEDLLWLTNSIVRGLAVRRLWQDEPARFERLFLLWRRMVTAYLESLRAKPAA